MTSLRLPFAGCMLLAFAGCTLPYAVRLLPGADTIRVSSKEVPQDCELLGEISGGSCADDSLNASAAAQDALRNQTQERGGDFARIDTVDRRPCTGLLQPGIEILLKGRAFKCSVPRPPPP